MSPSNEAPRAEPRRLGSYTTAKVCRGRVERLEQHVARLRRDAARLGLPLPDAREVERLFLTTARVEFGGNDGIVRLEWSHLPGEPPELLAKPRAFKPLPDRWRAASSKNVHPGREFRANTKYVDVTTYDLGREEVAANDIEEVLLFDGDGFLVEGGHSNFVVVTESGDLVTPDFDLGGVEGLGLAVLRHGRPELGFARLDRAALTRAREVMSVNAVRGVVPIVAIDGRPVGSGAPGPTSHRLQAVFGRR
ncbi:MAG: aminotransferase class IV [bacterium]|nr:aminotransferase class IV [bacterium]